MVHSLFIVVSVVCEGFVIGPCFVMQYLLPFLFAIISMRKRELVALF